MSARQRTGHVWEDVAGAYLEERGLRLLLRRYRCRLGELDLVCRDGAELVIVEVKARASSALVSAMESVDRPKQRRILLATEYLLMKNPDWSECPVRFDIVAIDAIEGETPRLRWIKNAFEAG